tara:strand:+ start:268 stop:1413 length:1146 start_codon:yes stop_codon:yes gene_type:complete
MFIPGPVGAAVALQNGVRPSALPHASGHASSNKRRRKQHDSSSSSSSSSSSKTTTEDKLELAFQQGPWLSTCATYGRVPPKCQDRALLVDWTYNSTVNMYKISDIASLKLLVLTYLIVLVDQINHRNGVIELRVRDESGFATATVHEKAAEMYSTTLVPGCVLLLKDVKIWRTKHPNSDTNAWSSFFLNVTANNLETVISASEPIPPNMATYQRTSFSSSSGSPSSSSNNSSPPILSNSPSVPTTQLSQAASSPASSQASSQEVVVPEVVVPEVVVPEVVAPPTSSSSTETVIDTTLFDDDDDEALMAMVMPPVPQPQPVQPRPVQPQPVQPQPVQPPPVQHQHATSLASQTAPSSVAPHVQKIDSIQSTGDLDLLDGDDY